MPQFSGTLIFLYIFLLFFVNALTSFQALPDRTGYGGAVILTWTLPDLTGIDWKVFIFKKSDGYVSDAQIAAYFAGTLSDEQLAEAGIFVFRNFPQLASYLQVTDYQVLNEQPYFYRALIQDRATNDISDTIDASATPKVGMLINVVDAKDLVARSVEKMLDTVKSVDGLKVTLPLNCKVFKSHSRRKDEDCFFVIERTTGQNEQVYLNSFITQEGDHVVKGAGDIDTMQVEWISMGNADRRDRLTNIVRIMRQSMQHFLMKLGQGNIQGVSFLMTGDKDVLYGQEGAQASTGTMIVGVHVEQKIQTFDPFLGLQNME